MRKLLVLFISVITLTNSFKRYSYITKTSLGEKTAEIIENAALQLIDESPAAE